MKIPKSLPYIAAIIFSAAFVIPANAIDISNVDKIVASLPSANDYACKAYSNTENSIFSKCFAPAKDNSEDRMNSFNSNVQKAKELLESEKNAYTEKNKENAATAESNKQKAAADKRLQQMSGMDIDTDSIQNMTEEQKQSFAMKIASRKMANAGNGMLGNMSQAEMMKLANMSEKEQKEYMMQKMSGSSGIGLTPAEMQKFSKMSDAEFEAYAKAHPDVVSRMSKSKMAQTAMANKGKANAKTKENPASSGIAQKQYMEAIQPKNMNAARKQIKALFDSKYKDKIKQSRESYSSCYIRYSPAGYIFADGIMSDSETKTMETAEKNCRSQKTWDSVYQDFTRKAGDLWAKAIKSDLSAIKEASENGKLKKMKISANFSNLTSMEMKNYVNNMPGIDGTDEYISLLEDAKEAFEMPSEADYCDHAWLARIKSTGAASEKNDIYNSHIDELRGCSADQLKAAGIKKASASGKKKAGKAETGNGKSLKNKIKNTAGNKGSAIKGGMKEKAKGALLNKFGL